MREQLSVPVEVARQRLDRLILEFGSVSAVSRALADRFGGTPQDNARNLWRIRGGRPQVVTSVTMDKLEVL